MAQKRSPKESKLLKINGFWISIILSVFVIAIYVFSRPEIDLLPAAGILELIEAKSLDMRFLLKGVQQPGDDIVIILVDEKTEDELGRWQTAGRRWIAQMLDILHEGGAKIVGFDLTLAEPDEGAALVAVDEMKVLFETLLDGAAVSAETFNGLNKIKAAHDYDRQLAGAIQRFGNVVLGFYHFLDQKSAGHLTPEKHAICCEILDRAKYTTLKFPPGITPQSLRLLHSFGAEPNLSIFSDVAKSFGHFTLVKDADGYIRKIPLLIEYQGDYYPSLNLEIARLYLNPPMPPIIHALGKEGGGGIDRIQLGDVSIPTDEHGSLLINFYGPEEIFPHYSLSL